MYANIYNYFFLVNIKLLSNLNYVRSSKLPNRFSINIVMDILLTQTTNCINKLIEEEIFLETMKKQV